MSDKDSTAKIVDPEERKKLIQDIANIKDVLDSFKYGLNFEDFADALFGSIDRQTIAVKHLSEQMSNILERMEKLETRLDEGIKVRVKGLSSEHLDSTEEVVIEHPPEQVDHVQEEDLASKAELRSELTDLEAKIGRLFEKENEFTEMALNDPASSDEYEEKARVAQDMRVSLEDRLREIRKLLNE